MRPLRWTPPAEADLAAIDAYWWSIDGNMADVILERIRSAGDFLRSVPQGGTPIDRTAARKWRAAHTPYLLIYRLRDDAIEILRVHHARQDWLQP